MFKETASQSSSCVENLRPLATNQPSLESETGRRNSGLNTERRGYLNAIDSDSYLKSIEKEKRLLCSVSAEIFFKSRCSIQATSVLYHS